MPTPVLNANPTSPTCNSYATVAEADTYHDEHLYATDWTGASNDVKIVALIMATRFLDAKYSWAGNQTNTITEGQPLRWPRSGMIAADGLSSVPELEFPPQLKWAIAEYARQLIVSNRTADSDIETQGITSIGAGPINLSFKDSVTAKVVPDAVVSLLPAWWGSLKGKQMTLPLLRN